jgi:HSP20 family protein
MAVTRYQPSTDLFRPFFDDMMTPFMRMGSTMRVPDTDVAESEHEIRVVCELPGMQANEVELSLENNVLTISGEKREVRREGGKEDRYHLTERRWGRFSRSFVLPREVDSEHIEANFENGVLTVTIPKSERAKPRRIQVRGGDGAQEVGTQGASAEQPDTSRGTAGRKQ